MAFLLKKDGGNPLINLHFYFHDNKNYNFFSIIRIFLTSLYIKYRLRVRCLEWLQIRHNMCHYDETYPV